jgi:hypothetical protein
MSEVADLGRDLGRSEVVDLTRFGVSLVYRPKPRRHLSSVKSRRAFHRLLSGLQFRGALRQNWLERVHIVLTESDSAHKDINRAWQALLKRIRRKFKFFEYCKVRVIKLGRQHLHIVAICPYIPQQWLSEAWKQLYNSPITWIKKLYGPDVKAASYIAVQYVAKQQFARLGYSWGWVKRGFATVWRKLVSEVLVNAQLSFEMLKLRWKVLLEKWAQAYLDRNPTLDNFRDQ